MIEGVCVHALFFPDVMRLIPAATESLFILKLIVAIGNLKKQKTCNFQAGIVSGGPDQH